MNETAYPSPPAGHFPTTVSMIHSGRFFHAGEPMPLSELSKIPANLRKARYLLFSDPHAKPSNGDARPPNLIYETGVQYSVDESGNRSHQREIPRQINLEQMRQEAEEQLAQQVKEELENPNPTITAALEDARDQEAAYVQKQLVRLTISPRKRNLPIRQEGRKSQHRMRCSLPISSR